MATTVGVGGAVRLRVVTALPAGDDPLGLGVRWNGDNGEDTTR